MVISTIAALNRGNRAGNVSGKKALPPGGRRRQVEPRSHAASLSAIVRPLDVHYYLLAVGEGLLVLRPGALEDALLVFSTNMRVEGVVVGEDAIAAEVALPAAIIRVVLGVVLAGGRSIRKGGISTAGPAPEGMQPMFSEVMGIKQCLVGKEAAAALGPTGQRQHQYRHAAVLLGGAAISNSVSGPSIGL